MATDGNISQTTTWAFIRRLVVLLGISLGASGLCVSAGLEFHQCVAIGVFLATVVGTLLFWNFRLAIAFLGIGVLILTKSLDIPHFVEAAALPVILFLVGMMILVGALRDLGFFTWIIQAIISIPNITGRKFILVTAVASALLACAVAEVTSIIIIATLVFQVCNRLKLNPAPYIIISVLCTNTGSAGTMLGNPVGIYIGTQAGLTFQDFMVWSFPIMLISLAATILLVMYWYRSELDEFDRCLTERLNRNLSLAPKVEVAYKRGLVVLAPTLIFISLHHQIERLLNLDKNSILLIAPLICAGVVMVWRRERARHYVEHEVDWWTLLFFMLFFAAVGTLEYTGVTTLAARLFISRFGHKLSVLIPVTIAISALGSAFVDNVVFVAAYSPIIKELAKEVSSIPLWWALLFGACFGGNITLIGSTANIVAIGMLEKKFHVHIKFWEWFKVGFLPAVVTCAIAWALLMALSPYMS